MFLAMVCIVVIGGVIWFQAYRIGKLQTRNAMLLELAETAMAHAAHMEAKYNIARQDIDYLYEQRRHIS